MTSIERYPVSPETVTVLGYRVKANSPMWQGLDFSKATVLEKASILVYIWGADSAPSDLHLSVPFCHPDDQPEGWSDGMKYRVRPRAEAGGRWLKRKVKEVRIIPDPNNDPPWAIEISR